MKRIFVAMAGLAAAHCFATDTITILRWNQLITAGASGSQVITNYPGQGPDDWLIDVVNNEGSVEPSAHAFRRRNQPGVSTMKLSGSGTFLVRLFTTVVPTSNSVTLTTTCTSSASGSAQVETVDAMAYARATTEIPAEKPREARANMYNSMDEASAGPDTVKKSWNFSNVIWQKLPGGFRIDVFVPSGKLTASATAIASEGTSNMVASSATGNALTKIKPTAMKVSPLNGNAGFISGSMDSFLPQVFVEVHDANDALLDKLAVGGLLGHFDLPFDAFADGDYHLYLWAPGALRKRVDVTYSNATGLSGLSVSLYYGDLNRNNVVTADELNTIMNLQGKTSAGDDWEDTIPGIGCTISDCDLNNDNVVNSVDYLMAQYNLNRFGD